MQTTENWISVAVCGAHMRGLPLNGQLLALGGEFLAATKTSPHYRLYRLAGFEPPRPGLVRTPEHGAAIDVEVWRLPAAQYGPLVASIPAPLCIGSLLLQDDAVVQGFLCESYAVGDATDITAFGGWRLFLGSAANLSVSTAPSA